MRLGFVNHSVVERSVRRVLDVFFRVGRFDPPESNPYRQIPFDVVGSPILKFIGIPISPAPATGLASVAVSPSPRYSCSRSSALVSLGVSVKDVTARFSSAYSGTVVAFVPTPAAAMAPRSMAQRKQTWAGLT